MVEEQMELDLRCWSQRVLIVDYRERHVRSGRREGDGTVATGDVGSIGGSLVLPELGSTVGVEGVDGGTDGSDNGHLATRIDEDSIALLNFDRSKVSLRQELVTPGLNWGRKKLLGGNRDRTSQEEGRSDDTVQHHGEINDSRRRENLTFTFLVRNWLQVIFALLPKESMRRISKFLDNV